MPNDKTLAVETAKEIFLKCYNQDGNWDALTKQKREFFTAIANWHTSATSELTKENEELKRMLAANPTPADMDAAIFEINRLTSQLSSAEAVNGEMREALQLCQKAFHMWDGGASTSGHWNQLYDAKQAVIKALSSPASQDFVRVEKLREYLTTRRQELEGEELTELLSGNAFKLQMARSGLVEITSFEALLNLPIKEKGQQ